MAPSILVVDDEPAICEGLAAYLEDEGMCVFRAFSGEDALLRVASGLAIDLCIMDLRLPGMSGSSAIRELGRLDPRMRFLIHTGSAREDVAEELQRSGLGPTPVFHKPVTDLSEMASAARRLLSPDNADSSDRQEEFFPQMNANERK
jgi:CheY-like chemotaxis protein